MATQETQREQSAPVGVVQAGGLESVGDAESTISSGVIIALLICLLASFLVAFVGFLTDRYAVLVVGASALTAATFAWVAVAVAELVKDGAVSFVVRRCFRRGHPGG